MPLDPCVSMDTDGDGAPDWAYYGLFDMSMGADPDNYTVDCDLWMGMEDWDDDGDGWADEMEWVCGSDHLDGDDMPEDIDFDQVCDVLDDDLDNDGAPNPVDCVIYLWNDDLFSYVDCLVDNFNAADFNDDGEVDFWEARDGRPPAEPALSLGPVGIADQLSSYPRNATATITRYTLHPHPTPSP